MVSDSINMKIPCGALVDSNMNPFGITYPIPSNNDTVVTLLFFLTYLKKIIFLGYSLRFWYLLNPDTNKQLKKEYQKRLKEKTRKKKQFFKNLKT